MLDSIVSPNNRKITLIYDFENITTSPSLYEESMYLLSYGQTIAGMDYEGITLPPKDNRYIYSRANIKQAKLKEVHFEGGNINLETSLRSDIRGGQASKLDKIKIKYGTDDVKSYRFKYSYFGNTSNPNSCRLILDSLIRDDNSKYQFSYNKDIELPGKESSKTDFWGYYSSATNSGATAENQVFTTIPSILQYIPYLGSNKMLMGSGRYPVEEDMKALILEKIQYPTGGYTSFEYEAHRVSSPEGLHLDMINNRSVPGLAIAPRNELANNTLEANVFEVSGESAIVELMSTVSLRYTMVEPLDCHFFIDKFNQENQTWTLFKEAGYFGGLFGHIQSPEKIEIKNYTVTLPVTDPRGIKTTYEYDSFNRLKYIRDENGNAIETYDYHYKN
jgi:YD repeat-containing protein